eukprot:1145862-Pyramimonas_sp.AAC.1
MSPAVQITTKVPASGVEVTGSAVRDVNKQGSRIFLMPRIEYPPVGKASGSSDYCFPPLWCVPEAQDGTLANMAMGSMKVEVSANIVTVPVGKCNLGSTSTKSI